MKLLLTSSIALLWHLLLLARFGSVSSADFSTDPFSLKPVSNIDFLRTIENIIGVDHEWSNFLNQLNLPSNLTIFFPTIFPPYQRDLYPSIIQYHVVPYTFSFSHLKQFKIGTRIPTLLPNKSIVVTSNTGSDFTIDGIHISRPDFFDNGEMIIHGIPTLLNESSRVSAPAPTSSHEGSSSARAPAPTSSHEQSSSSSSNASASAPAPTTLGTNFSITLLVVYLIFTFKI